MHKERLPLGPEERLRVVQVQGDLRLTGEDGSELRIQAGDERSLTVVRRAGWLEIESRAGCMMFQPRACETVISNVAGDLRVQGLTASLAIESVAGDLNLRDLAEVKVGRVDGNLVARKLRTRLEGTRIGGDALLEGVQGDVSLGEVGGDARLRHAIGSVKLNAGGDIRLELEPRAGSSSAVRAGGDMECLFPGATSAWLEVRAAGDLVLPEGAEAEQQGEKTRYRLGSGAAEVTLEAGGDLLVGRSGGGERREEVDVFMEDLDTSVRAQVEGALAAAASGLKSLEALPDAAAVTGPVQESLRSAGFGDSIARSPAARPRSVGRGGDPVESAEQMAILEMLQAGKINSQEAELLLRALEGAS